jgi:hypothetical protein
MFCPNLDIKLPDLLQLLFLPTSTVILLLLLFSTILLQLSAVLILFSDAACVEFSLD